MVHSAAPCARSPKVNARRLCFTLLGGVQTELDFGSGSIPISSLGNQP